MALRFKNHKGNIKVKETVFMLISLAVLLVLYFYSKLSNIQANQANNYPTPLSPVSTTTFKGPTTPPGYGFKGPTSNPPGGPVINPNDINK